VEDEQKTGKVLYERWGKYGFGTEKEGTKSIMFYSYCYKE
jgi:hypothetical protein